MTNFDFPNVPPGSPERALIDALKPHLLTPGVQTHVALNVLFNLYRYIVLVLPDEQPSAVDSCNRLIGELLVQSDAGLGKATPANTRPI